MRHLVVLPLLVLALVPAAASAARVTLDQRCPPDEPCIVTAHFVAAPGEANDLRVNVGGSVRFSDQNAPVEASPSCTREDERTVVCMADALDIRLGDGDDRLAPNPPYPPGPFGYQGLVVFGEEGNDNIVGYATPDRLEGGPGNDVIHASDGADTIVGGPGLDSVFGMEGDDSIFLADPGAEPSGDYAEGGPGADTVLYTDETRPVQVDLGSRTGGGAAAGDSLQTLESVVGGSGADQLAGDDGPNGITAGPGGGGILGRGGDDSIVGGVGEDTIDGGEGDDDVTGMPGAPDLLYGGPGDDLLGSSSGGLVDAGPGDDRVQVAPPPPAGALRVACGDGDDVSGTQVRVTLAGDCEWTSLGNGRIEVASTLRLLGRSVRAQVRGFAVPGRPRAQGRLVLRHAATGRLVATATWRERGRTPSQLLFRPRIDRATWRRLQRGGTLRLTIQDTRSRRPDGSPLPDSPRGRVRLVA